MRILPGSARPRRHPLVALAVLLVLVLVLGLGGHESDFGQTLALVGVPSGPYLILPVVGPTNARDGTGYLVDFLFRPTTYLLAPGSQVVLTSVTEGGAGIATLDANVEALHALEGSALDYYAALRSAYSASRGGGGQGGGLA